MTQSMTHWRKTAFALLALAAIAAGSAYAQTPDFKAMLKAIDENGDFGTRDYSAVFTIVTQKPEEKDAVIQVKLFRRDEHDQLVWIMLKPEAQKGQGFLKVGENKW